MSPQITFEQIKNNCIINIRYQPHQDIQRMEVEAPETKLDAAKDRIMEIVLTLNESDKRQLLEQIEKIIKTNG